MNLTKLMPSFKSRLLCIMATNMGGTLSTASTKLDTDSYMITIDNCCSYCMSNSKLDFVGMLVPCNVCIKGTGGENSICECGTVKWTIEDDYGSPHDLLITGTYYNPKSPYWLLSPQHWAQRSDKTSGTMYLTTQWYGISQYIAFNQVHYTFGPQQELWICL